MLGVCLGDWRKYMLKSSSVYHVRLIILALENSLKAEWSELGSVSIVELVLELHPVQTQGMQESREPLHHQQNAHCHACEVLCVCVCVCKGGR